MSTERKLMAVLWFAIGIGWMLLHHDATGYVFGTCWLVGGLGWVIRFREPKSGE